MKGWIAGALILLAGAVGAQEAQPLYQQGSWVVSLAPGLAKSDPPVCSATKVSQKRPTQSMTLVVGAPDEMRLTLVDFDWFREPPVLPLHIEVDSSGWELEWALAGGSVDAHVAGREVTRLWEQLARGTQVTLRDAQGEAVAQFALEGSKAAISVLQDCVRTQIPDPDTAG